MLKLKRKEQKRRVVQTQNTNKNPNWVPCLVCGLIKYQFPKGSTIKAPTHTTLGRGKLICVATLPIDGVPDGGRHTALRGTMTLANKLRNTGEHGHRGGTEARDRPNGVAVDSSTRDGNHIGNR